MSSQKSTKIDFDGNPDTGHEPVWRNGNTLYPLYDMDTRHIRNALNKYYRKKNTYSKWSWQHKYRAFWVKEFENELQARKDEILRNPDTQQFTTLEERIKHRAMRRLVLGLPPMKLRVTIDNPDDGFITTPKTSLFGQCPC